MAVFGRQANGWVELTDQGFNVRHYGAVGDGVTDDTAAFVDAIAAIAEGVVFVPPGDYLITSPIALKSSVALVGVVGSNIVVGSGSAINAIVVDGKSQVVIKDLGIKRTGVPASPLAIHGIVVRNGSFDVRIANVRTDGCMRGFQIGVDGTTACKDVTLRHCTATHSATATANNSQFGLCIDNATSVTVDGGLFANHWLDGIKLRTLSRNVKFINVKSNDNGVSFATGGNGNGIDAYYGGEQFQIVGGEYSHNGGTGVYIKTGDENESGGPGAKINNITITGPTVEYNKAAGLEFNQNTVGSDHPLVAQVTVNGGQYNYNGNVGETGTSADVGIYIRGRNVVLNGVVCRNNERQGIVITPEAFSVSVHNALVVANSQKTAGTYSGLAIAGKSVTVYGGIFDGRNDDYAANEAAVVAATGRHLYNIEVSSTADRVLIFHPTLRRSVSTPIFSAMTTGTFVVEWAEPSVIPEGNRYGGPGSKFTRTETGDIWVKHTGYGVAGWVRVFPYYQMYSRATFQLPAASALTGGIVFVSNGRKAGEGAGAGTGVMAFSDGTNWIACDSGAPVAA